MGTYSFEPITREMAADILKVSVGTVDKLVRSGILPRPQPLGDQRKLYWLPEPFFSSVRRALQARESRETGDETHAARSVLPVLADTPVQERPPKPRPAADRAARRTLARVKKMNS